MVHSKKWVDGLIRKPIVQVKPVVGRVKKPFNTPIASMWALTMIVAFVVVATLWLTAGAAAKSKELAFEADRKMLENGQDLKTELQQKIADAQQEKANRLAEEKRIAEEKARKGAEEARLAEEKRQARLIAMHRSQSSARSQAQPASSSSGGVNKTMTAYTPDPRENGGSSNTASGKNLNQLLANGEKIVASNDYALGTELKINGEWYTVEDRMAYGGVVDVLVPDHQTARNIGRRNVVIEEVR